MSIIFIIIIAIIIAIITSPPATKLDIKFTKKDVIDKFLSY